MEEKNIREIDKLAQEVHSWWGKTFIFIKKTRVKTWQGVFILAFVSGIAAALIWSVSLDVQQNSNAAAGKAVLKLSPDNYVALVGETFDLDINLDTGGNNAVVSKVTLVYNPLDFELQKWDTSQSVFYQNNPCASPGSSCEIVYNDKTAGKITLILMKPTPGIKTASGLVARLTFKALREASTGDQNFRLQFVAEGDYTDSDVILDDGKGTDILGSVTNSAVTALVSVCGSFTYSEWGACQPDGTQTRALLSSLPAGCKGGNPVLVQSCAVAAAPPETCSSFQYSEWGACRSNNTQSRTVLSSLPAGCQGGNQVLQQACVFQSVLNNNLIVRSVKTVKRGAALAQSGSGFSVNSDVTMYMYKRTKPAATFLPSKSALTDEQGNFSLTVNAPLSRGTYYYYAVDEATGKRSRLGNIKVN